jgi:hypothetical protein
VALPRAVQRFRPLALLVAAWGVMFVEARFGLWNRVINAIWESLSGGSPYVRDAVERLLVAASGVIGATYGVTLAAATLAFPVVALLRFLARATVRAGMPDPVAHAGSA